MRSPTGDRSGIVVVVGASRGLGLGLAAEFLKRGWSVIGTARELKSDSPLLRLQAKHGSKLAIETLDVNDYSRLSSLGTNLKQREPIDVLFINAGISGDHTKTAAEATTEDFEVVMRTNAFSPMKVIECLASLVSPNGVIAVMSSDMASLAGNEDGGWEIYRASKAALNMLMRSYAARHKASLRTLLAVSPGWVKTDMGGSHAPLDVQTSCRGMVDVILGRRGHPGLLYVDHRNRQIGW
jgi:NAD(P)-dependent dehydrogenase (short-subunit alcohol dehydrogenase family)